MARVRRKPPEIVSAAPRLPWGIVLVAFAAVLAAGGALVRDYARHSPPQVQADAGQAEIPAPELETLKP